MTWIALADTETQLFSPAGLGADPTAPDLIGHDDDDLLARGTLVLETGLPDTGQAHTLFHYNRDGDWPFHLSVQAIPGRGLIFVLNQGGAVIHQTMTLPDTGRIDLLRLSYSWDAPARRAQLALEQHDREQVLIQDIAGPCPLRVGDLRALFRHGSHRFAAPETIFAALSDTVEPVGALPSMHPETPIATPMGYRPLRTLRRGDTVINARGEVVPVLHRLTRTVPARGSFSPLSIRSPYFGLDRDIVVAPSQRLLLSGTEVEYLFGKHSVLALAHHLTRGRAVTPVPWGPLVTYSQLLLPGHEAVLAAGSALESQFIGRLHNKPRLLAASLLSGLERSRLPDHGASRIPVLGAFDARVLAERRAA
ncbi:Hint domain-containing protein [Ruegeria hyattellae]|uniref:Hint domain-containing protein n=1 Tax=Ruegeria hyattellae TaxID=3233337 RepID=UPI00355B9560